MFSLSCENIQLTDEEFNAIERIAKEDELNSILDDQDASVEIVVALIILKHNGWTIQVENQTLSLSVPTPEEAERQQHARKKSQGNEVNEEQILLNFRSNNSHLIKPENAIVDEE